MFPSLDNTSASALVPVPCTHTTTCPATTTTSPSLSISPVHIVPHCASKFTLPRFSPSPHTLNSSPISFPFPTSSPSSPFAPFLPILFLPATNLHLSACRCAEAGHEHAAAEQPTRAILLAVGARLAVAGAAAAAAGGEAEAAVGHGVRGWQALQHLVRLLPDPATLPLSTHLLFHLLSHACLCAMPRSSLLFLFQAAEHTASRGMSGLKSIVSPPHPPYPSECMLPPHPFSHIPSPTSLLPHPFSHILSPTSLLPPLFSHIPSPTSYQASRFRRSRLPLRPLLSPPFPSLPVPSRPFPSFPVPSRPFPSLPSSSSSLSLPFPLSPLELLPVNGDRNAAAASDEGTGPMRTSRSSLAARSPSSPSSAASRPTPVTTGDERVWAQPLAAAAAAGLPAGREDGEQDEELLTREGMKLTPAGLPAPAAPPAALPALPAHAPILPFTHSRSLSPNLHLLPPTNLVIPHPPPSYFPLILCILSHSPLQPLPPFLPSPHQLQRPAALQRHQIWTLR
ncbi:unnamed protein product [Closterium sp. Naga37s-1]|nr:unnamed protein product [Closterium sp. Naga37s-1]